MNTPLRSLDIWTAIVLAYLSTASVIEAGDDFELLIDLEQTGIPLIIFPPIPGPVIELPGSNPSQFLKVENRLYFVANDRVHGAELWSTDGTPGGTTQIADICPEECSSNPLILGQLHEKLIFWATDGESGYEPWISDGSAAGTRQLADICPGECGGRSDWELIWLQPLPEKDAVSAGDHLYFLAWEPDTGRELWRTDGTTEGTHRVTDVCPGSCSSILGSAPGLAAISDSRVTFWAFDETTGRELWATDGTTAWQLVDACPGLPNGNNGLRPASLGDRAIFGSKCGLDRGALWVTDGTPEGTRALADLPVSDFGRIPDVRNLVSLRRDRALVHLHYVGSLVPNLLWTTDGTPEGTTQIFEGFPDVFNRLTRFGERVAVIAQAELWVSDGTPEGTGMVAEEDFDVTSPLGSVGSVLLFEGSNDQGQLGLWAFDGVKSPRPIVDELRLGSGVSPSTLEAVRLPAGLVLPAYRDPEQGAELWIGPWPRLEIDLAAARRLAGRHSTAWPPSRR